MPHKKSDFYPDSKIPLHPVGPITDGIMYEIVKLHCLYQMKKFSGLVLDPKHGCMTGLNLYASAANQMPAHVRVCAPVSLCPHVFCSIRTRT